MSRFGVKGALVFVALVPCLVAVFALSALAVVTHVEADRSLDEAIGARDLGILSQALVDADSELAMFQSWSRSASLRDGSMGQLAELWIASQMEATDEAWDELGTSSRVEPEVVSAFDRLRTDLVAGRSQFDAGDVDALVVTVRSLRDDVAELLATVQGSALADGGAGWVALVELTDARLAINAEAVAATALLADGATPTALEDFDDLVVRTDAALQRLDRALADEPARRFADLLESDATERWSRLRAEVMALGAGSGPSGAPDELLRQMQLGSDFVRGISSLSRDTFDGVALAAEDQGRAKQWRRDLLVGLGAAALVLGTTATALTGRRLSRRITRVSDLAEQVSAGQLDVGPLELSGRDEVARLARTMDDMVETLRATDAQIAAIASGRTDDPSLELELPGPVGRNLRTALRRLGTSTAELKRQATHDALTGLLDRHGLDLLVERLSHAELRPIGVIVIDLDGFKEVNDEHGHAAGDSVLVTIAGRLTSQARGDDVVARTGGDEFVVLVPGAADDQLRRIADRIVESACEPMAVHGRTLRVGASVGWVVAPTGLDVGDAMGRADRAMYEAKRSGKGRAVGAGLG